MSSTSTVPMLRGTSVPLTSSAPEKGEVRIVRYFLVPGVPLTATIPLLAPETPKVGGERHFSVPRSPSKPRSAAPETPLPSVSDVLAVNKSSMPRGAGLETPLPDVPLTPLLFGPAPAFADPEAPAVPFAQTAIADASLRERVKLYQTITYDLSVIVPTRNEQNNIWPLLESLRNALRGLHVEVIFVDDSDDATPEVIEDAARKMSTPLFHIQLEHRFPGEARAGGLATAVVHGMNHAQAEYVAVIDADLQHPPEQLHVFYDQAIAHDADLVVASRYSKGGSNRGLADGGRRLISVGLKWTAKLLFPGHLLRISDPLSGFFLLRRALVADVMLRPIGYKILLEILLRCPWQQALEVPYHFQARSSGQSKSNMRQGMLALLHMLRLWREVPDAGRAWKVGLLLLLNVLVALALFKVAAAFPTAWSGLNYLAFGLMACLDFVLFNRFIFPSPAGSASCEPATSPLIGTQTASSGAETDGSLPAVGKADLNRHQVRSITEEETFKLPTAQLGGAFSFGLARQFEHVRQKFSSERVPPVAAVAAVILAVGWIAYRQPGPPLVLAVLLVGLPLAFMKSNNRDQAITMMLAIAVGVATLDYLSWRLLATNWSGWWLSVPLLCAEVFGALHVLGFQFTVWPWSPPAIVQGKDPTRLPIFIFIPTANEGVSILRPTLEGSIAARDKYLARYPYGRVTIVVCNDGRVAKGGELGRGR